MKYALIGIIYGIGIYTLSNVYPYTVYYYLQAVMCVILAVVFQFFENSVKTEEKSVMLYTLVTLAWYQAFWAIRDTFLPVDETLAGEWIIALFPFVRGLYGLLMLQRGYLVDTTKRLAVISMYLIFFGLLVLYYFHGAANWAILILLAPICLEALTGLHKNSITERFIGLLMLSLMWYQGGLALWRNLERSMGWEPLYGHPVADIVLIPFNIVLFLFIIYLLLWKQK